MDTSFRLLPQQASVGAERLDQLYFFLLGTAFFFTGLIFVLIVYFALRYRRGIQADRRAAPVGNIKLECAWSAVPLVIMMVSFGWGARLYVDSFRPPPDAVEIFVVGKQWMWKVHHAEGRSEINQLHIPVDQAVRLRMISEDVIHSFYVPAFRVKQDVLPGRYTSMWFQANRVGTYHLFCAEYCGTSHSLMRGEVIVQTPDEYAAWLDELATEAPHVAGQRLFERYRCESCHKQAASEKGPPLSRLFDGSVKLDSGEEIVRSLSYFRESLYEPNAKIVAGFNPLMPTYKPGQAPESSALTEEQVLQLAAYLSSLPEFSD